MPSFDTVCEADFVEVKNAVDNATKEIGTRFDFKGTSAAVELKGQEIHHVWRCRVPAAASRRPAAQQADQAQCGRAFPGHPKGSENWWRQGQASHQGQDGIESELAKKIRK
ncbi:DUF520 family protein [Staphylococcus epidermidis]|nr:DUF520 family protein [Staphylococcus epidermidis]